MPSLAGFADRIGPIERPGISPRLRALRILAVGVAAVVAIPLALLMAFLGPPSGLLAACALLVATVGTAVGRAPRVVTGALVLTGVLALWSEAQPSGGRIGFLVAATILFVGAIARWTFDRVADRRPSRVRWAALVVGCGAVALLSPSLAFEAKVLAFSPSMEAEARRYLDSHPVTEDLDRVGCREPGTPIVSGPAPRPRVFGPFSFDCVFVIGTEERPQVVLSSYQATVYEDHASGWEHSGLVYAPHGAPTRPPVELDEPYCFGHVVGDWYQFVQGTGWGAHGGCPSGADLIG